MASSSEAWGAEREERRQAGLVRPLIGPPLLPVPGVFLGWDDDAVEPSFSDKEVMVVRLLDVPADLLQGTLAHGAELRRELRLLTLAHRDTYPVASELSHFFQAVARDYRGQLGGEALLEALQTGRSRLDLDIKAPIDAEQRFSRLLELLDLADAFCRDERLLTLARKPEQVVFQRLLLFGEFVRQASGDEPSRGPTATGLPDRPRSAVAQLVQGCVVDPEVVGDLVQHRDPHLLDTSSASRTCRAADGGRP